MEQGFGADLAKVRALPDGIGAMLPPRMTALVKQVIQTQTQN
jgi:hypothetical protein